VRPRGPAARRHARPRRAFLKVAIATPLATGRAGAADPPEREVDGAVVGAGLAGPTSAREPRRHDLRVYVIGARDRVGGRTPDHPISGGHVAEGGQWVGPTPHRFRAGGRPLETSVRIGIPGSDHFVLVIASQRW
jgi:monoamine oxidase